MLSKIRTVARRFVSHTLANSPSTGIQVSQRLPQVVAGALLSVLAAAALLGQTTAGSPLSLPRSWGLVSVDTAAAFLVYGVGLISFAAGRVRVARVCGTAAVILSLLNLFAAFGVAQHLNVRSFVRSYFDTDPGLNMPMVASTATGVFLLAALLLVESTSTTPRRRALLILGYTLVLVVAVVPLIGYAIDFDAAQRWPGFGDMAALSALGLLVASGMGLECVRRLTAMVEPAKPAIWWSLAFASGCIIGSAFLYQALQAEQYLRLKQLMDREVESIAREVELRFSDQLGALRRMARRIEAGAVSLGPQWMSDAQHYIDDSGYRAVAWMNEHYELTRTVAGERNGVAINTDLLSAAIRREDVAEAVMQRRERIAGPVSLFGKGHGYYIYLPVFSDNQVQGILTVVYDLEYSMDSIIRPFVENGFTVTVTDQDTVVYKASPRGHTPNTELTQRTSDIGPGWELTATPSAFLTNQYHNAVPEAVLVAGVLIGLIGASLIHAWQLLTARNNTIGELNRDLATRVEQRTQALLQEVSARETVSARLAYLAQHDPLTGLANRLFFSELLEQALLEARRDGEQFAVLFLDLDQFKDVNDSLGHKAGDVLLQQVAGKLRYAVRGSDIVGRQGGDEFLVLLRHLSSPEAAAEVAEKVLQALRAPLDVGGNEIHIACSIGISMFPAGANDAGALIRQADVAMYHAKGNGRNRFEFFSSELQERIHGRLETKSELIKAIEHNELEVYYQPRIDLSTERLLGAEALIRWRHARWGFVSPELFVGLAEETGLIRALGRFVLHTVCADFGMLREQKLPPPNVSVNCSARQFKHAALLDDVKACLASHPWMGRYLELELTERTLLDDSQENRLMLQELVNMGIELAIDDFGTGCSSFAYFQQFPIHVVKIDKSFVAQACTDLSAAMITKTIIDLARNFHLTVVAEGIETAAQARLLREQGCQEGQGYLFGRPMPRVEFLDMWRRTSAPSLSGVSAGAPDQAYTPRGNEYRHL